MKISDRDKKLIFILILACIIALPILFVIRPCKEKTDALNAEIAELTERFNYLADLKEKQPFYEEEIVRLNNEKKDIIDSYAVGLSQEDLVMFLRNFENNLPLPMVAEGYTEYEETLVSAAMTDAEGNVTPEMKAISTSTIISFKGEYEPMKEFFKGIYNNKEKMDISLAQITYDELTGVLIGTVSLDQYAIIDGEKEMKNTPIPAMEHGNESVFSNVIVEVEEEALTTIEEEEEEETEE